MKTFDLEKALAGEPCVTRIGKKVVIVANLNNQIDLGFAIDFPLVGFIYGSHEVKTWTMDGRISLSNDEAVGDIVGMWEESRPTVTLTLPCPLKEPLDEMYILVGNSNDIEVQQCSIDGLYYDEKVLNSSFCFATYEDADQWLKAMRDNRR